MDVHEKLVLGIVTTANETQRVESRLAKALALVEAISPAELTNCNTEIFSNSD